MDQAGWFLKILFTRTNLGEKIALTSARSRGSFVGVHQMEPLLKSTAPSCGYYEALQANVPAGISIYWLTM